MTIKELKESEETLAGQMERYLVKIRTKYTTPSDRIAQLSNLVAYMWLALTPKERIATKEIIDLMLKGGTHE